MLIRLSLDLTDYKEAGYLSSKIFFSSCYLLSVKIPRAAGVLYKAYKYQNILTG